MMSHFSRRVSLIENFYTIAFIGLDIDELSQTFHGEDRRASGVGFGVTGATVDMSETYADVASGEYVTHGGDAGYDLMPPSSIINRYFSNIVYEHVLDKGNAVDAPTEAFYYVDDGSQYDDIANQAWNLKFYVTKYH